MITDRRGFFTPIWQALLTGIAFVAVGLIGFHHPKPHDVPVAITPAAAQVREALEPAQPGAYRFITVNDRAAGLARLRSGDAYAVIALADAAPAATRGGATPAEGTLDYAGANGPAVTGTLTGAIPPIAAHAGVALTPIDALPLRDDDTSALPLFYLTFGVVLASYLFSVTAVALNAKLPPYGHWASAAILATLLGLGAALLGHLATDTLDRSSLLPAAGLLALASLGTSSAAWLALRVSPLLGGVIGSIVLVILGSASGGVVPGEFQPAWLAALRHVLPMGTALQGIRDVVYFDGDAWGAAGVLALWAILPVLLGTVLTHRRSAGAPVLAVAVH